MNNVQKQATIFVLLLGIGSPDRSFSQALPLVYGVENTGADYPISPFPSFNQIPVIQALPDPFAWMDGRGRVSSFSDWKFRRAEIGVQIQNYEIGLKPARPDTIEAGYSAGVLTVKVTVNGISLTLSSQVLLPEGTGPFPAVIGMNSPNGSIPSAVFSSRNIARITFSHNQVTVYNAPQNTDPYYRLYGPALNIDNTGQYSAWAWGVSRIIDGLELVQNDLPIDLGHIAVSGCSYAGKMALFAGAFDERIALTMAQESGGGGATSWRYSATEPAGTVEGLPQTSHQWFSEGLFQFSGNNVPRLPIDHHELMAMCAPRALFVTANTDFTWLSNPSSHVCSIAARRIYGDLGIEDRFGFYIDGGHAHCQIPASQLPSIESFVDRFLLGVDTIGTDVVATPYNIDLSSWITWTTPALSADSSRLAWTSLRYPAHNQSGLDTSVTLVWSPVADADGYIIEVTLDQGFVAVDAIDSTGTDTMKTVSGLDRNKRYYWRVKPKSSEGIGLWSSVRSFLTVALPERAQLLEASPVDDRPGYAQYRWNKVDRADQYSIRASETETFVRIFRTASTSDTSIVFSGHSEGQAYYWQVQAVNIAGSGAWSDLVNFTYSTTGVPEVVRPPVDYSLEQNFPNPFNPTTRIQYSLRHAGHTTITLFDLFGREVQTLVDKELEAGYHEESFDASGVSSGVYFFTIRSGKYLRTRQMTVLK